MSAYDRIPGFDRARFEAWRIALVRQYAGLVAEVDCGDCNGSGETECTCCGNDADCETCGGSGSQRLYDFLDEGKFMECQEWDKKHLQQWEDGEALFVPKNHHAVVQGFPHPLSGLLFKAQLATGEAEGRQRSVPVAIYLDNGGQA